MFPIYVKVLEGVFATLVAAYTNKSLNLPFGVPADGVHLYEYILLLCQTKLSSMFTDQH